MNGSGIVVVGIDGSAVSDAALRVGAEEAELRGGRLVVAHAVLPLDLVVMRTNALESGKALCREATEAVTAAHPELECDVVLREVGAAHLLIELGASADLLVVGTHRMGRLRGWVLGSVSQQVAADAACPVMTISGPPDHSDGPIVLGASASEGGLAALRFACAEAEMRHRPVRAVRSVVTEDWLLSAPGYPILIGADVLRDAAEAELDKVLAAAQESFPDVSISGEVTSLNPYSAVLEAAADASLVVVGARRRRGSVLPRLGPVAGWLLHHAQCPLAVVGHRAHEATRV